MTVLDLVVSSRRAAITDNEELYDTTQSGKEVLVNLL